MDIQTSFAPAGAAQGNTSPIRTASAISSDFETFLKMLTVQMRNQDPLNPLDSTDFAVQLATFSGVEQQVRTNDLLALLGQQMSVAGMSDLVGWVGKEVRTESPIYFEGAPITLYPTVAKGADSAVLVVSDASGQVVAQEPLPLSGGAFGWAGTTSGGGPLPAGVYRLEVENFSGGDFLGVSSVDHYARVREVRSDAGAPFLVLGGDLTIPATAVSAVRMPASP